MVVKAYWKDKLGNKSIKRWNRERHCVVNVIKQRKLFDKICRMKDRQLVMLRIAECN